MEIVFVKLLHCIQFLGWFDFGGYSLIFIFGLTKSFDLVDDWINFILFAQILNTYSIFFIHIEGYSCFQMHAMKPIDSDFFMILDSLLSYFKSTFIFLNLFTYYYFLLYISELKITFWAILFLLFDYIYSFYWLKFWFIS